VAGSHAGRGSHRGESRGGVRDLPEACEAAGGRAYSGAAACRALRAGAHRAQPVGCPASAGRQPPRNAPTVTAPVRTAGPPSSHRAFCRRVKITVKSARCARVLRMALRATPDCDLPRQDPAPIRRTGADSTRLAAMPFRYYPARHPELNRPIWLVARQLFPDTYHI
jgi:hypothetical protein